MNIPSLIFALVAAVVCAAQLSTPTLAETLVLNNATAPPLTNDDKTGFIDIVVGEAFRRVGLELKLIKLPPERALKNANDGIDDGDVNRIAGLEKLYPNLIRVPEKNYDMKFVAFARDPAFEIDGWRSLKPYIVGLIKGWKIFEKNIPAGTDMVYAHDPEQLFTLLEKGRIDIALYSRLMGLDIVKRRQLTGVTILSPPLATREMFLYLHKSRKEFVPLIADALAALKREGFYAAEFKKIEARYDSLK